jgi:hypothetical protein
VKLDYLRMVDPIVPWRLTWWSLQALFGFGIGLATCLVISRAFGRKGRK